MFTRLAILELGSQFFAEGSNMNFKKIMQFRLVSDNNLKSNRWKN